MLSSNRPAAVYNICFDAGEDMLTYCSTKTRGKVIDRAFRSGLMVTFARGCVRCSADEKYGCQWASVRVCVCAIKEICTVNTDYITST